MADITPETYWQGIRDGALDAGTLIQRVIEDAGKAMAADRFMWRMTHDTYETVMLLLETSLRTTFEREGENVTVTRAGDLRFEFELPMPRYVRLWADHDPVLAKNFRIYGEHHSSTRDINFHFDFDPILSSELKKSIAELAALLPKAGLGLEVNDERKWSDHD